MRKAYIIIAHKAPGQLHRLITRLDDGNSTFFLHIDRTVDIDPFYSLEALATVHFLKRSNSKWGGLGTIDPFLSGLERIVNSRERFDRIMLLSGQDYPIKSNKQIDEFFENSPHSVFLNYFPIPDQAKWPGSDRGGLYRVDKYYFGSAWYQLLGSRSLNLLASYLPFLQRKLPYGMQPFTGQTWWNLDHYAAEQILTFHQQHPAYRKFHQHTFVADELFVQMIIGNTKDQQLLNSIENNEKRFTIWKDIRDAHPKILTVTDFEEIALSDDLFARKFDETIDREILDMIDTRLLNDR